MRSIEIKSAALRAAELRSERVRIIGLLIVLAALLLLVVILGIREGDYWLTAVEVLLLATAMGYEALLYRSIGRAIVQQRDLPTRTWILNVVVETQLPTIALVALTISDYMGPYRALTSSAVFVYFFFIVLSTLRLSPLLSGLTGLFSALGYGGVALYTFLRYPSSEYGTALPAAVYETDAIIMLSSGMVAGFVAGEIRKHVVAALREAELKQKVETMEHDLAIARDIQQGLLPKTSPGLSGFEIAGWNQPADQTGGDYFDWQVLPDGRLAVSIADATGHGIGSALVTAVCRAYSRASFPGSDDAAAVMDRINHLLVEDLPPEKFVTFVVALLDPERSEMEIYSAGHGPILVYRAATDEIDHIEPQGIPFGVISGVGYTPPRESGLNSGDMLILLTDGFIEWENPSGEDFGLSRLSDTIRQHRDQSPEKIIRNLYAAVKEFAEGTKQEDDLTAVILKRNPT